ncbi:MAG: hypothetical protein AAFN74_27940, partial [Myxococcota bacterium]
AEVRKWLVEKSEWQSFADRVYSIDPGDAPFLSYFSVDFTPQSIESFGFYFSFFRRLQPAEIDRLLPQVDRRRFNDVYSKWRPTKSYNTIHRGGTFFVKITPDGTITPGYHLRVPGRPGGEPARMKLSSSERSGLHGIIEEFQGRTSHVKRAFYSQDPTTIQRSMEAFGFQAHVSALPSIECLEHVETNAGDEVTWVTGDRGFASDVIKRKGPPHFLQAIEMFCRRIGFVPYGPGVSNQGRRS